VEQPGAGPLLLHWTNGGKVIWDLDRQGGALPAAPKPDLGAYAGCYFSDELETTMEVTAGDDGLLVRRMGAIKDPAVATPAGEDTFSNERFTFVFSRGTDGVVEGFELRAYLFKMRWKRTVKPGSGR